jgi:hypothetical protein
MIYAITGPILCPSRTSSNDLEDVTFGFQNCRCAHSMTLPRLKYDAHSIERNQTDRIFRCKRVDVVSEDVFGSVTVYYESK